MNDIAREKDHVAIKHFMTAYFYCLFIHFYCFHMIEIFCLFSESHRRVI